MSYEELPEELQQKLDEQFENEIEFSKLSELDAEFEDQ